MATQNLQVASSAGDADELSGAMTLNGAYIRLYNTNYWAGWFFAALAAAQGATINSATFKFKFTSTSYDDVGMDVYGDDADEAVIFDSDANDISGRTPTTATTQCTIASGGVDWQSVDVTAIIQEIVNRPGYVAGNDVAIIAHVDASNVGRAIAYDTDAVNCPTLDVDYTNPVAGGNPWNAYAQQ